MSVIAQKNPYPELLIHNTEPIKKTWEKTIRDMAEVFSKRRHARHTSAIFLEYALNAGKLIRPTLFATAATNWNTAPAEERILKLAVSFELLHLYLLIQDDIMDESDTRRNKPALHKLFEADHRRRHLYGNAELYGRNMALVVSDILSNSAEQIWTEAQVDGWIDASTRKHLDQLKETVYWGQHLDLSMPATNSVPLFQDILSTMQEKTARYTFYYPLYIGALIGAKDTNHAWIKEYGLNLGIAFQIVDDLLGTFGNPAETGKSITSDIEQRKQTMLVYFAHARSDKKERRMIIDHYMALADSPANNIRKIFESYSVDTAAEKMAYGYYEKSLLALNNSPLSQHHKELLKEFADFVISRQK